MKTNINLTGVLAVWGALLSSVTFGWNLLRDIRDRAKVELHGRIGQVAYDALNRPYFASMQFIENHVDRKPNVPTQFKLTITNVGRRRVRIEGWGGELHRSHWLGSLQFWAEKSHYRHMSLDLPKLLEEGESHEELSPDLEQILSESVSRIFAWDSTGKRWELSRSGLRKLRRELHSLKSTGKL